ncbi:MAG: YihY/virulence factor BrkB family protein [Candidatus Cloacimonetes bacterium]|nr:YihY/virulence factor BrkB family protein [Candidatus Cloacimonadota bacterium]
MQKLNKIIHFIKTDVCNIYLDDKTGFKQFLIKHLRIFHLSLTGFKEDQCSLRSSALTFFSFLSIVPVIAMFFSIAKGFGFEKILEKRLLETLPGQQEIITQIMGFAHSYLENTKGGIIAFLGILLLFYTVIRVLGNIERSFNFIWNIKSSRAILRKYSDYISIIIVSPILMILSSSATVFVNSHLINFTQQNMLFEFVTPFLFHIFRLTPFVLSWVLFALIYMIMPNTKVKMSSAFYAAFIAGTLFQIAQWAFIRFQFGVTKYNAIYGSFAALPLFLVWLQLGWHIVLMGAEISFAYQNIDKFEFEKDTKKISYSFRKLVILAIVNTHLKLFNKGEKPISSANISKILKIPINLTQNIHDQLCESGILNIINSKSDEFTYQPALDPEFITISFVLEKIEHSGKESFNIKENEEIKKIKNSLQHFETSINKSSENLLLKNI